MDTRATRTRLSVLPVFIALFFNVVLGPLATAAPVAAADGIDDYSQCQIGNPSSGLDCESWINGILNATHNNFSEDEVVPQRLVMDFDDTGIHTVTLSYMARKTSGNSAHAYDYLATWNYTYVNALRCQDLQAANCVGGVADTFPIPSDPNSVTPGGPQPTSAHELPQADRQFVMYGGDMTSTSAITHSVDPAEDGSDYGNITITFDVTDADGKVMLLFGGHLAAGFGPRGWGAGLGAAGISGGPYHIRVTAMDGASAGNRDNQIMSDAIQPVPGLAITKTTSTPVITAGDLASYTVTVTNSGQGNATGVTITDTLPSGVTWTENPDTVCTITGGFNLSCGPLTILAGTSFSVTVQGTTDVGECPSISNTASYTSTNGGSGNTTSAPTVITVNCPILSVAKTPDQGSATAGDAVTFGITTTNNGPGTAKGATLFDDLPEVAGSWAIVANPVGTTAWVNCAISEAVHPTLGNIGQWLSCGPEDIADDATRTVTVGVTLQSTDCANLPNLATADAANAEPASDTGSIDPLCPLIDVDKTPDDGTVNAPGTATFSIVTTNNGDGEARGTTLFDDLPEVTGGWTIVEPDTDWASCTVSSDLVDVDDDTILDDIGEWLSCGPENIPATGSDTRTVKVSASVTTDDCGPLDNLASVETSNDGSDEDGGRITVLCPEVGIEKTTTTPEVNAGDTVDYTITVTNTGDGDATGVEILDELPDGIDWSETSDNCEIDLDGTLTCGPVTIAANSSFSVTVTGDTDSDECPSIENSASFTSTNAGSGSTSSVPTEITVNCPDLELVKSGSDVVVAGDQVHFTIAVTNNGDGDAETVVLTDNLPALGIGTWEVTEVVGIAADACTIVDDVLKCTLEALASDASFSVTVSATSNPDDCPSLTNDADVTAGNEPADLLTDNEDTYEIGVVCPDTSVTKTGGAAVSADETASFQITVTAGGSGLNEDVGLTDELIGEVGDWTFDVTGADDGTCEITDDLVLGTLLSCEFGDLAPDKVITIDLTFATDSADCPSIANTATVTAADDVDVTNNTSDPATVTVNCPDLTVDKLWVNSEGQATTDPVNAGETAYFAITVSNVGLGTAFGVDVLDFAPDGTVWTVEDDGGFSCPDTIDDAGDTCTAEAMTPGSSTILLSYLTTVENCGQLTNEVEVSANNEPLAKVTILNSDSATAIVECPGLNILKRQVDSEGVPTSDPIIAGDTAYFEIVVWNSDDPGIGTAFDVVVTENEVDLPDGVSWTISSSQGSCASSVSTEVPQSFSCDLGDLEPGDSVSILVSGVTDREDCGALVNTARVDASNNDDEVPPATATILVSCPEISLDKVNDAVGSVLPGTTVGYTLTLTVSDEGLENGEAADVTVYDVLPVGLDNPTNFDDGGIGGSVNYDADTRTVTWILGDLGEGTYELTYDATVADDVENGEELINAAAATSTNSQCPDLETLGPECEADSPVVVRVPTLVIDKVANAELITITGPNNALVATPSVVTWTLTYTLTNGPVTNAVITDEVPVGFEFLDASNGGTESGGVVTWILGSPLEASGSVTFRTTVDPETISRVAPTVNVAVIDSDETPEDEGEDSVRVTREEELGGNPTPRPSLPNTAAGIGLNGEPITVPIELLAAFFIGSLGALALANVKARNRRR